MKETSETLTQQTLWDISTSTCSQESERSVWGCLGQDTQVQLEPSQGDFPAKMCLMQGNEQELKESVVDSGRKCTASFKRRLICVWDRISFSWRTCQLLLTGDYQPYSETWPKSGWMQDGACYKLHILKHRINESGYSLWPTPTASNSNRSEE